MSNVIKASAVNVENIELFDYKNHMEVSKALYTSEDSEIIDVSDADEDLLYNQELDAQIRQRIEEVINEAKAEAEQIKKQANEEGYNDGYKEGMKDSEEYKFNLQREYDEKIAQQIKKVENENINYMKSIENKIVDLITLTAKSLVDESFEIDSSNVIKLVIIGLTKISEAESIIIKSCEDDFDILNENKDNFQKYFDPSTRINIITDRNMKKGDCVIETSFGIVDCGINTKIKSIVEQIEKVMRY